MDALRARHADEARPLNECAFPRLSQYFSAEFLSTVRVVTVAKIPFPPLDELQLTEAADLIRLGLAAIPFDDMIYVNQSINTESIHFHELVHAVQWRALGVDRFLLTYGTGLVEHGYARNPLEAVAYDLQSQFDRNVGMPNMEAAIVAHAHERRDAVAALFARHGLKM